MMSESTLIKIPVTSFRNLKSPNDDELGKTYVAIVSIKVLPKVLDDWRGLNPRDPKVSSGVSKKILETLKNEPELFLLKNRGITLLVESVEFDNKNGVIRVEMSNSDMHGLLDGGHTFRVIQNYIENTDSDSLKEVESFVKLEILEGVNDRSNVISIVEARNTSTQVKEQSIEELKNTFEEIHKVLKNEDYSGRIAYKEHELLEDESKKDIDIKEILSYLVCFDTETFDHTKHPIKSYSTKAALVSHFSVRKNDMEKYVKLLPQILELRDEIYYQLPDAYNKSANNESGGKFGLLTGVSNTAGSSRAKNVVLEFTGKESTYRIPSGFIYPILASFRNLVGIKDNKCYWKADPIRFFEELKYELAARVGEQAKQIQNPNKLGKDNATWRGCYDAVALEALRRNLT